MSVLLHLLSHVDDSVDPRGPRVLPLTGSAQHNDVVLATSELLRVQARQNPSDILLETYRANPLEMTYSSKYRPKGLARQWILGSIALNYGHVQVLPHVTQMSRGKQAMADIGKLLSSQMNPSPASL